MPLDTKTIKKINVGDLVKLADGKTELNLRKLGYGKLLGSGKITLKLKIQVDSYSARAEEKIKAAGGELVSIEPGTEKKEKAVPESKEQ